MAKTVRLGIIACILLWQAMVVSSTEDGNSKNTGISPLTTAPAPTANTTTNTTTTNTTLTTSTTTTNSSLSTAKIAYGNNCTLNEQCATGNAHCINEICKCNSSHSYHDEKGNTCKPKIAYGNNCTLNVQCATDNALCITATCKCNSSHSYHDEEGNTCKPKIAFDNNCTSNEQCATGNAHCITATCKCNSSHSYHDEEGSTCKPKISYGNNCSSNVQCATGNALCITATCKCNSSHSYHDEEGNTCKPKIAYGNNCTSNEQCATGNALCITATCKCNSSHSYHDEEGNTCKPKIAYGNNCTSNEQCATGNALCITATCKCNSSHSYHDEEGSTCKPKIAYGNNCTSNEQCATGNALCITATCKCNSSHSYHDEEGNTCKPKIAYGNNCTSNEQCATGNALCITATCKCNSSHSYHDEEGSTCKPKIAYGNNCTSNEQCATGNALCITATCKCNSSHSYHYEEGNTCKPKIAYGNNCASNEQCATGNALCITATCKCNSSHSYHDEEGNTCKSKIAYGNNCTSNEQCATGNALCITATCKCNSSHSYHDEEGNTCKPKISYGNNCSSNVQCATGNALCITATCKCNSSHSYHDEEGNTCKPKIAYGNNCTSNVQCATGNALCITATCKCNSSHSYHDEEGNTCKPKIAYGSNCSSNVQCASSNAPCINEKCQCNSSYSYHDEEGNTCTPRIGYNMSCTMNGSLDQCMTDNAQCIASLCLCSDDRYYSNEINQNNTCGNQGKQCVDRNDTCLERPLQPNATEIRHYNVAKNQIIIGWGNSGITDNNAVRMKLVSPIANQAVFCSKDNFKSVTIKPLQSGTEYKVWFYIEKHCIPSKHQELTTYTVPEIGEMSVDIANTKEREFQVELTSDQHMSCQMYEFNLTSGSTQIDMKRINWTNSTKYRVTFTNLTSATEYIVSVAALAGLFRSKASVQVTTHTRPPPVKTAEVIKWYNSSLYLNVSYEGPNRAHISYCYFVKCSTTDITVGNSEGCFLNSSNTQETILLLQPGTKYTLEIYSYLNLEDKYLESRRSEYSFNLTTWTRPQNPTSLEVISRSENHLELNWKVSTVNHVEKVVIDVYNGSTFRSQDTFDKGNATTGNHTVSGLDAGTEYTIHVYTVVERRINLTSEGNYSISAYTRPSTPYVEVIAQEGNSIKLRVGCESDYDQIRVFFDDNNIPLNVTTDGEANVTELVYGTSYTMRIFSMISGIGSENSTVIDSFTRPGPPHNIRFPLDSLEEKSLYVQWEEPAGHVDSYILHIQNETYKNSGTLTSNDTLAYNFSNLEAGKQYSVNIVTVWQNLNCSLNATGTMYTRPYPPSTNSYSIADITTSTFTISLNTSHQPYDFILFLNRKDENNNQPIPINQTSFGIKNLSVGMNYIFDVYSIIGGISSKRYQTLISYTLPGNVTNIMGNFKQTTDTSLSVIWTQPQGHVDRYTINATCTSPNHNSTIKTQWNFNTSGNATEVTLAPLDPGTNCKISVGAVLNNSMYLLNDSLEGELVESSSDVSTREAAPGQVVIESIVTSSTSLNIPWNPPKTPNGIIRKYMVSVKDNYRDCIRARYSYSCNSSKCDAVHEYKCSSQGSSTDEDCSDNVLMNKTFEDPNVAREIVTRDLHPYRNYTVTVQAFTKCWGDQQNSIKQTEIDRPSQPPSNFSHNVTNSTITITWKKLDALTDGNGPIQVYTIQKQYTNNTCSGQADGVLVTETVKSSNSCIVFDKLRPYWTYDISVSASTSAGEGPSSNCTAHNTCNILTAESEPAIIQSQKHEAQKTSVNVSWSPPCRTNGIITNYILKVINTTTHQEIVNTTPNNDTHAFISGLLPYRNYTVQVAASTKVGQGQFAETQNFRTLVDKPRKPRNVTASVDKTVVTTLNVIWRQPDLYTGPTKYNVTATDTRSFNTTICTTGEDFNATLCNVKGLYAYWNYTVNVESITKAGSTESDTVTVTTGETAPGKVQDIYLHPEKSITAPRSIIVSWEPPSIRDLNGKLIHYYIVVNKTRDYNGETVEFNRYTVQTDPNENITKLTENISPGNYTISVFAATKAGNGTIDNKFAIVQPGAPINDKENNTHLLMLPGPTSAVTDTEKQISVNLPMEQFLCDDTNGQLKKWGVIVVSAENILRNETPFAGLMKEFFDLNKKSWFQVKDQSYFQAYRATPDDWNPGCSDQIGGKRRRRSSGQEYKSFTIGASGDCSGVQTTYCNGQLKPDQQYRVKSYACTDTGCTETRYSSPISTAPQTITEPVANYVAIIAGVVVAVVVIAVVAGIVVMKRRQMAYWGMAARCFNKDVEGTSTHKPGDSINMDNVTNKSVKSSHRFVPRPVKLPEFPDYVEDMHRDSDLLFADAFKMLRENSPSHSLNASEQQCSRPKNRYTNILPFDHSRVKLRPSDDIEGSDYINANYIPGYTSKREYIATQGPMLATFDDFWRMVWEQNVDTIVMLTKLMENGRHKCDRYWPEQGEPIFYGDLVVSIQSESNLSDYTLRIIEVKMKEDAKTIHQFCYLKWPDMGCPEKPEMLLQFVKEVRQYAKPKRPSTSGPIIVHCSAGVGRTGTFIAVDHLLQHIRDHDEIDVYKLVIDMRNHRLNMVQTEDQFIYIHECINSFISTDEDMEDDDEPVYENTRPGKAEENLYANTAFDSYE